LSTDKTGRAVGYVLKKFPVLSETFILNELLALEARGVPLHIFSLERPNDPRFHEDLPKLKARVAYVPDIFELGRLIEHHRRLRKLGRRRHTRALLYAAGRLKPTLFWRFLQSGYVANEAHRLGLCHLHAHFANRPASVAFFASRMTGIPFSFTAHAMDIYKARVNPRVLARKIDEARFVVTVSDFNKAYLEARSKSAPGKVVRLYNGIDLTRFVQNGTSPRSPFTILAVARLVEKKGLNILIEACKCLRDRGMVFRCWIVGKGLGRPRLEALIKNWKLRDHVHLLGPLTQMEVLERYLAANVYVLPCIIGADGNRDGLPVSIVEALACGLPVVTTPVTGIPEVVRHDANGLLVPSGDPGALAGAIESLIRDEGLYERLRENARPSVTSRFDLRQNVEVLHRLLEGAQT
jgi:glycosyltransferase involved in cell wall biosynthesis